MSILTSAHLSKGKIIICPNESENIEAFINILIKNGYEYLETMHTADLVFSRTIELLNHSQYELAITREIETLVFGKYTKLAIEYIDFDGKIVKK